MLALWQITSDLKLCSRNDEMINNILEGIFLKGETNEEVVRGKGSTFF